MCTLRIKFSTIALSVNFHSKCELRNICLVTINKNPIANARIID